MIDTAIELNQEAQSIRSNRSDFHQRLQQVIAKIQIRPDLAIVHPDYPTVQVSGRYQQYLQHLSQTEQDRYISSTLEKYLYDILMEKLEPLAAMKEDESETSINQGDRWYETEFFQQLVQNNHGRGYSDSDWTLTQRVGEYWQVTKDGLTIYIHPAHHLSDETSQLEVGQTVSIIMPPSLIDRGKYIAVGNAGSVSDRQCSLEYKVLQLYCNTDSDTALNLLNSFTQQLNSLNIPFNFRLAYCEADFQYMDTAILEFMSRDWLKVKPVIKDSYLTNKSKYKPSIPFFCLPILPGLGLAEKPFFLSGNETKNLGHRYCRTLAQAIVENRHKEEYRLKKANYILELLSENGTNSDNIYLNPGSEEDYNVSF